MLDVCETCGEHEVAIRDTRAAKRGVMETKLGVLLRDCDDTVSQSVSALGAAERNRRDRQEEEQ